MTSNPHSTTVSDEAVQAALEKWFTGCAPDSDLVSSCFIEMHDTLIAALPHLTISAAPCSVEVKKLEWRAYGNQHMSGWQGMGGMGYLHYISDTGPDGEGKVGWFSVLGEFDTADQAKDAAQADFERRILSQIVTKPVDVAAVRRQAFEEIAHIATQQKEYWDNKQRDCKALEDAYSENGDTYTPLGDDEAWKAGYANGHFSEACWLLGTIRALTPAEPDANSHVCQSKTIGDLIHKAVDECHVNSFAAKMKDKLAIKRQQGRTGWWDMLDRELSAILRQCVEKGDPVDVANLSMMLSENGQSISPAEPVDQWQDMKALSELSKLTYAIQHNPNCLDKYLVRLPGKAGIDLKPYGNAALRAPNQTNDILGFGKTLHEAYIAATTAPISKGEQQ